MPGKYSPTISKPPLLSLRGITKSFPGVLANDHIDLDIHAGEIHALLGENGAGKSTLMKILYGFYRMDAGEILLNGKPVRIASPHDARDLQIGMVFQDLNLIPAFTVAENIALFLRDLRPVINPREIHNRIAAIAKRYDLGVRPQALVSQLSIGEQQKVEILKLLLSNARIFILDEPTRVLAPHEIDSLFAILENLRRDGFAIILITHKLQEVLRSADRISVLRGGKLAGTLSKKVASEKKLVEMMFERSLTDVTRTRISKKVAHSDCFLELRGVTTRGEGAAISLKDINLAIHPGEIVGVAGVSGNGQKELGDVVLGLEKIVNGSKWLLGKDATHWSTTRLRREGVVFIPENPLLMAAIPWLPVLFNSILTRTKRYALSGGLKMDWSAAKKDLAEAYGRLGFSLPPFYAPARSLSGGNLQRMVIARELAFQPKLIVASYLTRGLDVQSAIAARQALVAARKTGAGILLISEELEELFTLSDRFIVLFGGKIAGEFTPEQTNLYQVGLLMTGSKVLHGEKH